jgi:hypothetical protein
MAFQKSNKFNTSFVLGSFYQMEWFTSLIFFWEASKILSVLNAHMILVFTLERLVEEKNK